MSNKHIQHGRCLFSAPSGFKIIEDASPIVTEIPEGMKSVKGAQPPVSLSLRRRPDITDGNLEDYSETITPDVFPPSITLLTLPAQYNPDPLIYLQQAATELQKAADTYHLDFCEKTMVGPCIAAYSQSSIELQMKIYKLTFAWIMGPELVTAEMLSLEKNIQQGWIDIKAFADSVELLQT